jgi:starch-binding outer membrane protein, SusD/RagB family
MIKRNIFLQAFVLLFGLSSCTDFLEQTSKSEYEVDYVFSLPSYTESAINGIYSLMTMDELYSSRLSLMYSVNSDIEVVGADASSYNTATNRGISNYFATPTWSGHLDKTWTALYKGIERANLAIAEIPKSPAYADVETQKQMQSYLGEALTLRALYYFELVRHWGDVPFKLVPTNSDGSNFFPAVEDRDVIMEHLLNDLDVASNYLSWGATPERVNKGFALGLKARIALWRGGYSIRRTNGYPTERGSDYREYYQIARDACYKVISEGPHKLNPSYVNIFKGLCSLQTETAYFETMFEVAMGLTRSSEVGYSIGVRFRTNNKYGYGNNANVYSTTPYYFYQFDSKDVRRSVNVAVYEFGPNSKKGNKPTEMIVANPFSWTIGKYDQRWMSSEFLNINYSANQKIGSGINWAIMRYADILLMFAEAENELNEGPTSVAKDALKQVRSRAFIESDQASKVVAYVDALSSKDEFFKAIMNDRMFEFGGEGIRKYDLVRWNKLGEMIEIQREGMRSMINNGSLINLSGATVTMPSALHYKYNTDGETIDMTSVNFYEDKGTVQIVGYEAPINWMTGFSDSNKTNYLNIVDKFSSGLNAPVNNRHLFPIYQEFVTQSNGSLSNSYGY